ncbi:hypothetical protein BC827DRAFT_1156857 [Russula dissimulans]|nr:hypothetical protein BC827DRAFT_1156857 [Russula dissimulans]
MSPAILPDCPPASQPTPASIRGSSLNSTSRRPRVDDHAGWAWLATFAEMLESGEGFEVGVSTESKGNEDDVDDEGHFFNGTERGAGEEPSGILAGGMCRTGEYWG